MLLQQLRFDQFRPHHAYISSSSAGLIRKAVDTHMLNMFFNIIYFLKLYSRSCVFHEAHFFMRCLDTILPWRCRIFQQKLKLDAHNPYLTFEIQKEMKHTVDFLLYIKSTFTYSTGMNESIGHHWN